MSDAALTDVDLEGADLASATLAGADLTDADLTDADLYDADFYQSTLEGTILTGAQLTLAGTGGVQTSGGIIGTPASLPPGYSVTVGNLLGPGVQLYYANLAGADLDGVDLTGAEINGAVLSGDVTGTPIALPAGYQLLYGYLVGPYCDLAGVDLSGMNLSSVDLLGVVSGGLTGTPIGLPPNWDVLDGYLVGPGASLANVNFAGLDLSGLDLQGAVFGLSNLTDANLSGSNLESTSFGGANLTGANLTGVDLTLANLVGSDVTGADFTGATWSSTTCPDGSKSDQDGGTCINNLQLPPSPTDVVAMPGNDSITVSWSAPSNEVVSGVTEYTASAVDLTPGSTNDISCRFAVPAGGSTGTDSCIIPDLINGDPYQVSVVAQNANWVASPPASPSGTVIPEGP